MEGGKKDEKTEKRIGESKIKTKHKEKMEKETSEGTKKSEKAR